MVVRGARRHDGCKQQRAPDAAWAHPDREVPIGRQAATNPEDASRRSAQRKLTY